MRPRELTIEGFRSYRGATTFDWRDRRLVGIVGPIGAGKSSILDAVAFALYGKTPGIGSATKSLIHQQCTEAHVSLTFEVEGQIWQAVRAPKRKGQSGHQLKHLAADEPDAEVLETVTMEGAVNERITHLLGMDFDTFCRSVLLAQNRFSDFLKATKTDRDKVLKGVFGFEQIDAAKLAAERRLDRETMALEAFAREREGIDQARERLEEARGLAEQTRSRLKAFEDCAPRVEELVAQEEAARSDADVAASRIDELARVADTLPPGEQVSAVLEAATEARGTVEQTKAAVEQAERARELADADLIQVRERLGDREQLRTFERLVEQLDEHGRAFAKAADAHAQRERQLAEMRELVEQRHAESTEAQESLARADDRLEEASAATKEAHVALATARHAEMAHELRGSLVAGDPCPVCAQPVATLPKRGAAPKAVSAAEKALAKAERSEADLRAEKERLATTVGAATKAVSETEARLEEGTALLEASTEELRGIEAELTAVQDRITERLGEGEPHELVKARESELEAAEVAAAVAATAMEVARRSHEEQRERADAAQSALTTLAVALASAWGALAAPRPPAATPDEVRAAFVDAGEEIVRRHDEAGAAATDAAARATAAADALADMLRSLELEPDQDFVKAHADVGAAHAGATARVEELSERIARSGDLEREALEAEARQALARRLSDDLKPSKFLAFLLEEERAELAELGSGMFETLTGGNYRFSADDSFDILDLNAADRPRKADSLSGGETFLASLSLALALAEMVARGGGRLDAFFLDEGFGSLDPEHLDRAMEGIGRLVADDGGRLVVLVSHVAEMREAVEDLVVLDKDDRTGDTIVVSGAVPA